MSGARDNIRVRCGLIASEKRVRSQHDELEARSDLIGTLQSNLAASQTRLRARVTSEAHARLKWALASVRLTNRESERQNQARSISRFQETNNRLTADVDATRQALGRASDSLSRANTDLNHARERIRRKRERISSLKRQKETVSGEKNALQTTLGNTKRERDGFENDLSSAQSELQTRSTTVESLTISLAASTKKCQDIDGAWGRQGAELLKTSSELSETSSDLKHVEYYIEEVLVYYRRLLGSAVNPVRFDFQSLEKRLSVTNDFGSDLENVKTATNLFEIEGLVLEAPTAYGPSLVLAMESADIRMLNVNAMGNELALAEENTLRRDVTLLYTVLWGQREKFHDSPMSLRVLRAFEVLLAHVRNEKTETLFTEVKKTLTLDSMLCSTLADMLTLPDGASLATRLKLKATELGGIRSFGDVFVLHDAEHILVVKDDKFGVLVPHTIELELDPIDGMALQFRNAPIVGSWRTEYSWDSLGDLKARVRTLNDS